MCINTLKFLIDYVEDNSPSSSDNDVLNTLSNTLDNGILVTPGDNVCCECSSGDFVFSSVSNYITYINTVGLIKPSTTLLPCCTSVFSNVLSYVNLYNTLSDTGNLNNCCLLDFRETINEIADSYDTNLKSILINKGVVLQAASNIGILAEYFTGKSNSFVTQYMTILLDKGVVFICNNLISSVSSYFKYIEAIGLTPSP